MTVYELLERLQELVDEDDANGEREIHILHQPSWPMVERANHIYDPFADGCEGPDSAFLLVCTQQVGYGPKAAFEGY